VHSYSILVDSSHNPLCLYLLLDIVI